MKKYLASLSMLLIVAACTTPDTPAQAIYAAEGSYAAALRVELAYSNLPRCNKTTAKLCSEASIIKQVQKIDDSAWTALKEAQTAVRTPAVASARSLVNAFVGITNTLKIK